MLSRRALLLTGAAAASLAALGVSEAVLPAPAPGFRLLAAEELVVLAALGEAFFPAASPLGVAAADVDLPARVDALLAEDLDPVVAPVFRYLLDVLETGTLVSRGSRFSALPLAVRREVVDTWAGPVILPRRLGYDALKSIVGMAFFNTPEVTAKVGWSPRCQGGPS